MKNNCVTLVEPKQIAKKGYQGCKSSKAVIQFARKYGVPSLWWKPTNGQRVLLIEPTQFGQTWKQIQGGKTGTKNTRTTAMNGAKKTTTMWKNGTRTNATSTTRTSASGWKNGTTRATGMKKTGTTAKTKNARSTSKTGYGNYSKTGGTKMRKTTTGAKRWTMSGNTNRRTNNTMRRAA